MAAPRLPRFRSLLLVKVRAAPLSPNRSFDGSIIGREVGTCSQFWRGMCKSHGLCKLRCFQYQLAYMELWLKCSICSAVRVLELVSSVPQWQTANVVGSFVVTQMRWWSSRC